MASLARELQPLPRPTCPARPAPQIAGAGCLSLLNDTTATAIAYGVYKGDLPEGEAVHVAFVDVGYGATQVCAPHAVRQHHRWLDFDRGWADMFGCRGG